MDQMKPVGTGPWFYMSPTGELIQVGISDSGLKGFHTVCIMIFNSMGLLYHQMGKKVGAGSETTTYMILTILLQMVLGFSLVVHLTSLRVQQYRKLVLMIMKLQLGKILRWAEYILHQPRRELLKIQIVGAQLHPSQRVVSLSPLQNHVYPHGGISLITVFSSPNPFILCPFPTLLLLGKPLTLQLLVFQSLMLPIHSRDAHRWSSASSSLDFADVSELFESETSGRPHIPSDEFRCSFYERFLSQRSPWNSHRIVRSGDMPTTGVLPCCHVFYAECLEPATPKIQKNDPPCPVCQIGGGKFP